MCTLSEDRHPIDIWVRGFTWGILEVGDSHCAMCTHSKAHHIYCHCHPASLLFVHESHWSGPWHWVPIRMMGCSDPGSKWWPATNGHELFFDGAINVGNKRRCSLIKVRRWVTGSDWKGYRTMKHNQKSIPLSKGTIIPGCVWERRVGVGCPATQSSSPNYLIFCGTLSPRSSSTLLLRLQRDEFVIAMFDRRLKVQQIQHDGTHVLVRILHGFGWHWKLRNAHFCHYFGHLRSAWHSSIQGLSECCMCNESQRTPTYSPCPLSHAPNHAPNHTPFTTLMNR